MEPSIPVGSRDVATLAAKTSPWLGWQVQFFSNISDADINNCKPLLEKYLDQYLQDNVNVSALKLLLPFTCKMVAAGGNGKLYNFQVKIYKKILFFTMTFNYPAAPVLRLNNYIVSTVRGPGTDSPVSTVALRPPAPVN